MSRWHALLGRCGFLVAMFLTAYLGARLGMMSTPVAQASHNFSDVPNSAFYHNFVQFLVDNGITGGCGGGRFCGEDPVTRGQMAVFLKKLSDVVDTRVDAKVAALGACPNDAVRSGTTCIDKYEASVWETTDPTVIAKIRAGTVTLMELQAGATQRGLNGNDYAGVCPDTGAGCLNLYAVSIPGVIPSRYLTWFQAAAAARNSEKRLPTNAEWQAAALGTPDPGVVEGTQDCNVQLSDLPLLNETGSRANCVSNVGAFDMVGNLQEWVADWVPLATTCAGSLFGTGDLNCLAGVDAGAGPGALLRGSVTTGTTGTGAGVYAINALYSPTVALDSTGFRAAR